MTLIAHWPIDDGLEDNTTVARDTTSNHDGVYDLDGNATLYPGGVGGRHLLAFGGFPDGGYITSIANPAGLRLLESLTLSAWIWVDEFSSTFGLANWSASERKIVNCSVANGGTSATNNPFMFKTTTGGKLNLSWQNGTNNDVSVETSSDVLIPCGPQHVACVRYLISGSNYGVKFYVNGTFVEDLSTGWLKPDGGGSAIPYVGRDSAARNSHTLFIDSVRVYDEELNDTQIEAIYDEEEPQIFMPISQVPEVSKEIIGAADPYTFIPNGIHSTRENAGWSEL